MTPRFAVTCRRTVRGRRWRWNLLAPNGEVIATSEAYNSRQAALDGADAVRHYAPRADVHET